MFTWEKHFRSNRPDGRLETSLAAVRSQLRSLTPALAFDESFTLEEFADWRAKVRAKLAEIMRFPPITEQPRPVLLETHQRDGYRVEKWEFYPDDWSAVPVLILVPDGVTDTSPAPAMLCFPGSASPKESLAGEPLIEHPNCQREKFPDRNRMALHYARAGCVAVAFDNPGTGILAEQGDEAETQWRSRDQMCNELLFLDRNYLGISVFQKMRFLEWFRQQDIVDSSRIGVSGHSLGSEVSMVLGVIDEGISVVVHNDFLCCERSRRIAITNFPQSELFYGGFWHAVPGMWNWFGFPDLLAATAPKPLAINEGGPWESLNVVRSAYRLSNAEGELAINHYPKYSAPQSRKHEGETLPTEDLSWDDFWEYAGVEVSDHSFRPEYSVPFVKRAFNL